MNEVNLSEVVDAIMNSSNSEELGDRFEAAYNCRDEDEDLMYEDLSFNLMKAISSNNIDSVFFAFCGASATDILKKGLFIPDERHRFYQEIEEVEVEIQFNNGTRETVFCNLNTDTHEIYGFEINDKDKDDRVISKIIFNFCCLDCEVYPKSDMYDDDKWSFWYDDEKWRKN